MRSIYVNLTDIFGALRHTHVHQSQWRASLLLHMLFIICIYLKMKHFTSKTESKEEDQKRQKKAIETKRYGRETTEMKCCNVYLSFGSQENQKSNLNTCATYIIKSSKDRIQRRRRRRRQQRKEMKKEWKKIRNKISENKIRDIYLYAYTRKTSGTNFNEIQKI